MVKPEALDVSGSVNFYITKAKVYWANSWGSSTVQAAPIKNDSSVQ